ncbi:MAG: SDR family oxidoreductase [Acidimicrobiia bacterium]|nr:SDR family oxidoreductase [Acidimicrobiia bacterium]
MPYQSIFRTDLFAGQVVVVTGGGTGIGRCTAHELAALGATVVLLGRRSEPLEATTAEITGDGGRATWHACDIRDEAHVGETVGRIVAEHDHVDGLVNNAGGQFTAPLAEMSQKGFEVVVRTNLVGGFLMAREVFTQSMRGRGGVVVNVTADHRRGIPYMGHSSAARAGMANLTRTLAVEWASEGVRVNAVAPGFVASSGYDTYGGEPFHELLEALPALTLARRHGTEAEVSAAIVFLLSPGAAYVTGQELLVGGGTDLVSGLWPVADHDRLARFDGFHRSVTPAAIRHEG